MKHFYLIIVAVLLFSTQTQAQTAQDTMYFWKTGTLILKQSIKAADLDSITFKRPVVVAPATITIGTQIWTSTNLDVTTYTDGTPIPQVTDQTAWAALKTGAWCYNYNITSNGTIYGKLYNWYAVAGIHDTDPNTPNKKLTPTGYHIPTDAEWTTLTNFLGGESIAGGKMKSSGNALWTSPNIDATNSSGFTGLPGGIRNTNGTFGGSRFGVWVSATEIAGSSAWQRSLSSDSGEVFRGSNGKGAGFSVRCLKD